MTLRHTAAAAVLGMTFVAGVAHAAPITYNLVSQNVGSDSNNDIVTTSGTITTDGTIGVLNTNNITAFNIVLTEDGLGSFSLTDKTATVTIIGQYLTASKAGLSWNYAGGVGAEFSVVTNKTPNTLAQFHFYTNRTDVDLGQVEHYTYFSGESSVSTNAVSPVPLPASAPLFGAALLGFAGLGYAAKRKKASAAA